MKSESIWSNIEKSTLNNDLLPSLFCLKFLKYIKFSLYKNTAEKPMFKFSFGKNNADDNTKLASNNTKRINESSNNNISQSKPQMEQTENKFKFTFTKKDENKEELSTEQKSNDTSQSESKTEKRFKFIYNTKNEENEE